MANERCLVSYFITKPQHGLADEKIAIELFSILFHHQTTTASVPFPCSVWLFSILFHHQTTTYVL